MAKIKIQKPERGHQPNGGWYFTSYRLPVDLAQKIDRVAQKESKDQGVNISFSTATIELLQHALKEYGPTPGFKSDITATELKKGSGSKKADKAEKKASKPAKAEKKASKAEKKAAKKAAPAKKGKGLQVKLAKKKAEVEVEEDEVEVTDTAEATADDEVEVELED